MPKNALFLTTKSDSTSLRDLNASLIVIGTVGCGKASMPSHCYTDAFLQEQAVTETPSQEER